MMRCFLILGGLDAYLNCIYMLNIVKPMHDDGGAYQSQLISERLHDTTNFV